MTKMKKKEQLPNITGGTWLSSYEKQHTLKLHSEQQLVFSDYHH